LAININSDFYFFRDTRVVAERAEEILSIVSEIEIPLYSITATFFRGWAMASAGRGDEGMAEMHRSISNPVIAKTVASPTMLVALAEACGKHGRAKEGLDLVTEGLATAEQTGWRMLEAELHRVKGEILMIKDPSNVVEAERSLRTAIDVARRQGARLFELRATVSLARLLEQQGKIEEAREMLTEIYNWFTEGFEFADLKDAKALIDELNN
jgi:predicted ATPase